MPQNRKPLGQALRIALGAIVLCQACLTKEPSREGVPSSTPSPAPTAPEPAAAEGEAADETIDSAPALEPPSEDVGGGAPSQFAPAPPSGSSAPSKARARRAPARESKSAEGAELQKSALPGAQALVQRLDDAVVLGTPDCPSARNRKTAICDLARQICELVDRDPNVASVAQYCDDAKQRCSEAAQRTIERCDR